MSSGLRRDAFRLRLCACAVSTGLLATVTPLAATSAAAADVPIPSVPSVAATVVSAPRSVPGYAAGTIWTMRSSVSSGAADLAVRLGSGSGQGLWGDWNGDGVATPALFRDGTWTLHDGIVGWRVAPVATFSYGTVGDIAVAGDWDGDGRTGIAIYRGGTWKLRQTASPGAAAVVFTYGASGYLPVAGDWDGDRRDTMGIVRPDRSWALRNALSGGSPHVEFSYGAATDRPVVGDWDADGVTGVGVVRYGKDWLLRDPLSPGPPTTRVTVAAPSAGAAPAPWRTPEDYVSGRCPTAFPGIAPLADERATSVRAPVGLLTALVPTPQTAGLRKSLRNAVRYLGVTDFNARYAPQSSRPYFDVLARTSTTEHSVRSAAMSALAFAITSRASAWKEADIGRSRAWGDAYVAWMVRSVACQHRAMTPGGWGNSWQSAFWAYLAGFAGWLVWDSLPPQVRGYVATMVEYEADRFLTRSPEYWRNRAGTELFPGDTKAEEDAWNANILQVAAAMMPPHARRSTWLAKNAQFTLAAYSRHADLTSTEVVNGYQVGSFLGGYNAFDNGTVVNHGILHPDYMSSILHNFSAAMVFGLADDATPASVFWGGPAVYGGLTRVSFASPPYLAPGGTIFRQGSNEIYYPQGTDWGKGRRAHWVAFDALADLAEADGGDQSALSYLDAHLAGQLALQARNADGRTYTSTTEDRYASREEYAAQQVAFGWLAQYVRQVAPVRRDNGPYAVAQAPDPDSLLRNAPELAGDRVPGPPDPPRLTP